MESYSLNFVEILPEEINEMIFMKLSCRDLLNAMQVHSTWSDSIGASRTIMDNVKLSLNSKRLKSTSNPGEVCETLKESRRHYQHLQLDIFGPKTEALIDVIDQGDWKSLQLCFQVKQNVGNKLIEKLKRCSNLVSLELGFNRLDLIEKLLKSNKGLRVLKLSGRLESDDIFSHFDASLQTLAFDTWRDYNKPPSENSPVFNKFLKAQAGKLKSLSIDFGSYGPYIDQVTLETIMTMPKLKNLTINIESHFLQPSRPLKDLRENRSVVNLNLLMNFHNIVQWGLDSKTKSFMSKFRNLKTLQLKELHRSIFQFIQDFDSLEEVIIEDTIYMSSDTSNVNAFPNLRSVKFGRAINPELEQRLKDAVEDELGNFSRCLLTEVQNHPNNEREYRSAAFYPTFILMASDLQ